MRTLDVATQGAIQNRARITVRDFVLVFGRDVLDDPVVFGFTNFGEDVTLNVVDPLTGAPTSRSFFGDNSPLLKVDPIPMKVGMEVDTTHVELARTNSDVMSMVQDYRIRQQRVHIYRGYIDSDSGLLVANPRCRRLGFVNGAPVITPAAGGSGRVIIRVVSHLREFTRTSGMLKSYETQKLRDDDEFRRYTGVVDQWQFFWGEVSETPTSQQSSGQFRAGNR